MGNCLLGAFMPKNIDENDQKSFNNDPKLIQALVDSTKALSGLLDILKVRQLTERLQALKLMKEILNIKPAFGGPNPLEKDVAKELNPAKSVPSVSLDKTREAMFEALEKISVAKTDQKTKKRVFLLHRATQDFEYDNCASSDKAVQRHAEVEDTTLPDSTSIAKKNNEVLVRFITKAESEWVTDFITADKQRSGKNPIVSIWVPEENITSVNGSHSNNGTWGEMGKNPQEDLVHIVVKAGDYAIYSELKS
jgi:hypothetical protein